MRPNLWITPMKRYRIDRDASKFNFAELGVSLSDDLPLVVGDPSTQLD